MREAASRGFWMTTNAPYGYQRVYVQDGAKKRPRLALNPPHDAVVRRIFDLTLQGKTSLDILKTLNSEGIPSPMGKQWRKTTVHKVLGNEAYTGTLVWGENAKDNAPPVRVENAFPAIVTQGEFARVRHLLESRAPKVTHPRRAASPYLLSGLAKCETCGKALTAAEAKSGKYTYYVCQSMLKLGKDACNCPRLNAKDFEQLIISTLREHILTESNIRDLVKMLDEEMDGVARSQRDRLETVEAELAEVRRKMDRIWYFVENTELDMADASERILEHRHRREHLEAAAEEARAVLAERRQLLDSADVIAAFATEMGEFLRTSEITETRAFIRSFVKEVTVVAGKATIIYTIPTPKDSPIRGADMAEVALNGGFRSTIHGGGPDWTKSRTDADSLVTPSLGMGMVYVRVASPFAISIPCTKLRINALRSGKVPSCKKLRKSATYPLISLVVGSSTLRRSNWPAASSRAAVNWSCRDFNARMRGDRMSMGKSFVSRAW